MKSVFVVLLVIILCLWMVSKLVSRNLEMKFPPIGSYKTINGARMHFVDSGTVSGEDNPAVIFVHGAASNLRDLKFANAGRLEDRLRVIYLDRPGHGYSQSFEGSNDPKNQAKAIAGLMDALQIQKAVIVGHSFGGSVASTFGVLFPKRTAGLVLIAQASHPWPTGLSWYYDVAGIPGLGRVFTELIVTPVGNLMYAGAVEDVFAPDPVPKGFAENTGTRLVLRPENFYNNAKDVNGLLAHVETFRHRYKEIEVPTVIFHGDKDTTVDIGLHSINGLAKDIEGAELRILEGMGHMPTYFIADEIAAVAGKMAGLAANQSED